MTEDEQTNSIFKASLKFGWSLLKGLMIPFSAGLLMWCVSYPLGAYSCRNYSKGIHLQDWQYSWFMCFVQEEDKWYTKEQYEASQVGVRLIIAPELKLK